MGARRRFLIDPAGAVQELSPAGLRASPALRRQLGETGAATGAGEVDLARLVERQGFACLSLGARALVHVNVRRSTPHTTAALLIMLAEQTAQRFAVSYYDAAWSHHLFHGKAHAINHIAMTLDEAQFAPGGQLRKRALPLSAIHRWPALASVLDVARAAGAVYDARFRALVQEVTADRYLTASAMPDGRTLQVIDVGTGYGVFTAAWRRGAVGRPLHEQPDYNYGRWLRSSYLDVIAARMPALEEIDAVVFRPDHGRRRFTYVRLALPLQDQRGGVLILSASMADAAIDIGRDLGGVGEPCQVG